MSEQPITYAGAGVDVEAGDKAVELMKASVARATRPEVLGGLGGFAGMFDASALRHMRRPVLATSTDGVGTKVAIAQALDRHDTIGADLVGMVVDDIVVCGAEPLFMTDGGETAEHPGLLDPDEYDVAGAATGVVEHDDVLGPARVRAGDAVVALGSSGLHSNGYSLVRAVIASAGWSLEREVAEFGRTLGEELLEPTRIYTRDLLALIRDPALEIHALSHVTGGGLAANLARVLPAGLAATIDRGTWTPAAVFDVVARLGNVPRADLERTLNLGVGFVVVVPGDRADATVRAAQALGQTAWIIGEVLDESQGSARHTDGDTDEDTVRGAKGVDGGAVTTRGEHPA